MAGQRTLGTVKPAVAQKVFGAVDVAFRHGQAHLMARTVGDAARVAQHIITRKGHAVNSAAMCN